MSSRRGKAAKVTKDTKIGKGKQNGKEELRRARKAQNQHRSSKEQEKLKICTKAQNQHSP
jgi:hypothetical protein